MKMLNFNVKTASTVNRFLPNRKLFNHHVVIRQRGPVGSHWFVDLFHSSCHVCEWDESPPPPPPRCCCCCVDRVWSVPLQRLWRAFSYRRHTSFTTLICTLYKACIPEWMRLAADGWRRWCWVPNDQRLSDVQRNQENLKHLRRVNMRPVVCLSVCLFQLFLSSRLLPVQSSDIGT